MFTFIYWSNDNHVSFIESSGQLTYNLRRVPIPKQCNIKGECKIGLLRSRHILIRFVSIEDFVNMMSKTSLTSSGKKSFFSLVAYSHDMATTNKTNPSCARFI